jgi:hypothetical protein
MVDSAIRRYRAHPSVPRCRLPACCSPIVSLACGCQRAGARTAHGTPRGHRTALRDDAGALARWRETFFARLDEVRGLGYPDTFIRMWEFYLCYCEAGFAERALGDIHMTFAAPK